MVLLPSSWSSYRRFRLRPAGGVGGGGRGGGGRVEHQGGSLPTSFHWGGGGEWGGDRAQGLPALLPPVQPPTSWQPWKGPSSKASSTLWFPLGRPRLRVGPTVVGATATAAVCWSALETVHWATSNLSCSLSIGGLFGGGHIDHCHKGGLFPLPPPSTILALLGLSNPLLFLLLLLLLLRGGKVQVERGTLAETLLTLPLALEKSGILVQCASRIDKTGYYFMEDRE